jgi:hypothetical protein
MREALRSSGKSPLSALGSQIGESSFSNWKRPSWPPTTGEEIASDSRSILENADPAADPVLKAGHEIPVAMPTSWDLSEEQRGFGGTS